jgi:tRNA (guanine37-N1)-methyltransferase
MNNPTECTPNTLPLPIPSDSSHVYPGTILSSELKKQLQTKVTHHALIIPARLTAQLRKSLSSVLMHRPKVKDIYPLIEPDDVKEGVNAKAERKLVLGSILDDENDGTAIYAHDLVKPLLDNEDNNELYANIRKSTHDVIIGYEHFTVEQVLSKILPSSLLKEIPSSFEVVGSIAHINLRDEYLPFKHIIGRTILDKNKSIQVCVNKTGTIQNEFRTFPMEIIADDRTGDEKKNKQSNKKRNNSGDDDDKKNDHDDSALLEVDVKEDGCKFRLDFENVYWNSRLQYEHRRIVHLISGERRPTHVKQRKNENNKQQEQESSKGKEEVIVADACAGIGPFAVPLTSQYSHVKVYANDLNPISFKYLNINSKINKCNKLHTYNMDGRYFLRKLDDEGILYQHVLMNLPAIAPEFLNVFQGWKGKEGQERPWIHVHCFGGKGDGADDEAIKRCSRSLGCQLDKVKDEATVHIVRDVSPKKNMLCVSFRLPEGVKDLERIEEFGSVTADDNESEEPSAKKART